MSLESATIFGLEPDAVARRVGAFAQVSRIDRLVEADGPARGARRLRVVTGGGLEFEVHPDRCLDIGNVTMDGIPVAWVSPTGFAAPGLFDPHGSGWLQTFGGGLLATCGLDTFGSPSVDEGRELGQHGRVGAQPAQVTRSFADSRSLVIEGEIRQARVLGENLVLRRRIVAEVGSASLRVEDSVKNEAFETSAHMMLYHANFGWPLVSDESSLQIPSTRAEARDADAEEGLSTWTRLHGPVKGQREQVYLHHLPTAGSVAATISNPRLGLAASIAFSTDELPYMYQWKMLGEGTYVVGLEPANCPVVFGRAAARAQGELPILEPGEERHYSLEFSFSRSAVAAPPHATNAAAHDDKPQRESIELVGGDR